LGSDKCSIPPAGISGRSQRSVFNNSGIERFNLFVARDDGSSLGKLAANGFLSPTLTPLRQHARQQQNLHAQRMDNSSEIPVESQSLPLRIARSSQSSTRSELKAFSVEIFVTQIELKADEKFSHTSRHLPTVLSC
jgi:hypothetical protein